MHLVPVPDRLPTLALTRIEARQREHIELLIEHSKLLRRLNTRLAPNTTVTIGDGSNIAPFTISDTLEDLMKKTQTSSQQVTTPAQSPKSDRCSAKFLHKDGESCPTCQPAWLQPRLPGF